MMLAALRARTVWRPTSSLCFRHQFHRQAPIQKQAEHGKLRDYKKYWRGPLVISPKKLPREERPDWWEERKRLQNAPRKRRRAKQKADRIRALARPKLFNSVIDQLQWEAKERREAMWEARKGQQEQQVQHQEEEGGHLARVTFFMGPEVTKDQFIEHLSMLKPKMDKAAVGEDNRSVTILATPRFTKWLEDVSVMAALLGTLLPGEDRGATVVTAVVDALCPLVQFGRPREGFSIMLGDETTGGSIIPTPFKSCTAPPPPPGRIQFIFDGFDPYQNPVAVDLPLANTIFQNGREHTLNKNFWTRVGGNLKLVQKAQAPQQTVVCRADRPLEKPKDRLERGPEIAASLVALTKPRKIISCLGNIISQIQVEDESEGEKVVGASAELESAVETLREDRRQWDEEQAENNQAENNQAENKQAEKKQAEQPEQPTEIWALITPPLKKRKDTENNILEKALQSLGNTSQDPQLEQEAAISNQDSLLVLLERGCQLYRVASGGGGWDRRSSRLALDTDMCAAAEDSGSGSSGQELEGSEGSEGSSNMRLNTSQDGGPPILQSGSVVPASWIVFLTPPRFAKTDSGLAQADSDAHELPGHTMASFPHDIMLGMSTDTHADDEKGRGIQCIFNHFGGLSTRGVYVKCHAPTSYHELEPAVEHWLATLTGTGQKMMRWCLDDEVMMGLRLKNTHELRRIMARVPWERTIKAAKEGALDEDTGVVDVLTAKGVRGLRGTTLAEHLKREGEQGIATWPRPPPLEKRLSTKVDSPHSYVSVRGDGREYKMHLERMQPRHKLAQRTLPVRSRPAPPMPKLGRTSDGEMSS